MVGYVDDSPVRGVLLLAIIDGFKRGVGLLRGFLFWPEDKRRLQALLELVFVLLPRSARLVRVVCINIAIGVKANGGDVMRFSLAFTKARLSLHSLLSYI